MKINNVEELKAEIQKVLVSEGFIEFCKKCPYDFWCCKPMCEYRIKNIDCKNKKPLACYFFVCPTLNEKNKEVSNWLMRVRGSITFPNKLEFPFELEEFKNN